MKIAIIGFGNIGKHVYNEVKNFNHEITIIDIKNDNYKDVIKNMYDMSFVCVPTDMLHNGHCDTSVVESVISKITSEVFLIKSAIPPGTTEKIKNKTKKRIVYSPEFYGTTIHSEREMPFVILGGEKKDCNFCANFYSTIKRGSFRIVFTDLKTAELVKYMENSFLALKVTFCNEFATLAKKIGVEYAELRELFVLDERMGNSHTFVYEHQPYYDSHCLNKDIPALLSFAEIDMPIMRAVYEENSRRKNERDKA